MDKQKVTVRVAGRSYTLVSQDSPEYMQRVAALADQRLNEMSVITNQSPAAVAILTCIQLADELLKSQAENAVLRKMTQGREDHGKSGTGGESGGA